jgi:hypothetical protein
MEKQVSSQKLAWPLLEDVLRQFGVEKKTLLVSMMDDRDSLLDCTVFTTAGNVHCVFAWADFKPGRAQSCLNLVNAKIGKKS